MTLNVRYSSFFKRQYKGLTLRQKTDFKHALQRFVENPFDPSLKTHKLQGKLQGFWSFSINYSDRVLFKFSSKEMIDLINIGGHSIYR